MKKIYIQGIYYNFCFFSLNKLIQNKWHCAKSLKHLMGKNLFLKNLDEIARTINTNKILILITLVIKNLYFYPYQRLSSTLCTLAM